MNQFVVEEQILYGSRHTPNNFADGVVNSALRFRAQAPIVDQLLKEIGIEGGAGIGQLVGGATGAQPQPNGSALPPADAPKGKG